jgi:hypothetical protein
MSNKERRAERFSERARFMYKPFASEFGKLE